MRNWVPSLCGIVFIAWLAVPVLTVPWTASPNAAYILNTEKHFPPTWPRIAGWRDVLRLETYDRITRVLQSWILPRRALITAKKALEFHLLREPRMGGVDRGTGGWLFLRETYDRYWEHPERTRHALDLFDAYLSRGPKPRSALRLLIAPSKYTLYPEHLSAASASVARRYGWYHRILEARLGRPSAPERIELWSAYRRAQARTTELLFFPKDTHHTPLGAMVMLRALTEALSPGLWREEDVRTGDWAGWRGDLVEYAGVALPQDRYRRRSLERPGVTLLGHERPGPQEEWGSIDRFRFATRDRPLWPGKTLIAHDSMLMNYRTELAQFFADATFLHYKELIGGGRFRQALETYDTVVLEIGERYAVDILERLFQPLVPTPPAALIPPADLDLSAGRTVVRGRTPDLLDLETTAPEAVLRLPVRDLDPRRPYLLEVNLTVPKDTWCRSYLRRYQLHGGSEVHFEEKVLWQGTNQVYFFLSPEDLWYPPDLVLYRPGRYRIGTMSLIPVGKVPADAGRPPLHTWVTNWRSLTQGTCAPAVISSNPAALMHVTPGRLWIESRDHDPQLLLSGLPAASGRPLVVALGLWSSRNTLCQIFFQSEEENGYSETRSQTHALTPGKNQLTFRLPATAAGRTLRLDPGCHPGWYGITDLVCGPVVSSAESNDDRVSLGMPPAPDLPVPLTWLAAAQGLYQVRLELRDGRLRCRALSDDPQIMLPSLDASAAGPFSLNFRIEAPIETLGQVFFQTAPGQEFRENNSLRFAVHAGLNSVSVQLPAAAGLYPLRLDPGCHLGVYTVWEFAVSGAGIDAP